MLSARTTVVAVVGDDAAGIAVERLEAGRWWPPLDRLLERVRDRPPDDVRAESAHRGAGLLDPAGGAHPPASELVIDHDEDPPPGSPHHPEPRGTPAPRPWHEGEEP